MLCHCVKTWSFELTFAIKWRSHAPSAHLVFPPLVTALYPLPPCIGWTFKLEFLILSASPLWTTFMGTYFHIKTFRVICGDYFCRFNVARKNFYRWQNYCHYCHYYHPYWFNWLVVFMWKQKNVNQKIVLSMPNLALALILVIEKFNVAAFCFLIDISFNFSWNKFSWILTISTILTCKN